MGLLQKLFGKSEPKQEARAYGTFTESAPAFAPFSGAIYQQELTRSCIERFATACSKLKPEVCGTASPMLAKLAHTRPNDVMTWPTFFKRLAALYDAEGTAFIVPVLGRDYVTRVGMFPLKCEYCEVVDVGGEPWARFTFANGERTAFRLGEVCILSKFQVTSDFFGEPNCLDATMQLIDAQNKAQSHAIKNGAKVRFIGTVPGMVRQEQLEEKRRLFIESNFESNDTGMMVYDQTFTDVRQIEPQSYVISSEEMGRITDNVCRYFGMSKAILDADFTEDQWGSWYESKVEPFAVQLADAVSNMWFTRVQQQHGNRFEVSANRLEYSSNPSKRNMVRDMLDRGVFSINEAREILQMPPVEWGGVHVVRGEYVNTTDVTEVVGVQGGGELPANVSDKNGEHDGDGDDKFYHDSDSYGAKDFEE